MGERITPEQAEALGTAAQMSTAGPWLVWSTEGQTSNGRYRHSVCIEPETGGKHTCIAEAFGDTEEEAEANAIVVAAAPRLLAELAALREEKRTAERALQALMLKLYGALRTSGDSGFLRNAIRVSLAAVPPGYAPKEP